MKIIYALMLLLIVACQTQPSVVNSKMQLILESQFDTLVSGKKVALYTLMNDAGTVMQVTNFGARVVSLWTADRDGNMEDIVIGYDNIEKYIHNKGERFLGATIGRYGNRIADGKFSLNGENYSLSTYNNGQCLHGGDVGFDMVVWSVDSLTNNSIYFSYLSKDMEEGFPGNLDVHMVYTLTSDNEFVVEHRATTDKDTPVNLTHHSFFNLKGEGNGTINDHLLMINADSYNPVKSTLIPTGEIASVESTPFDFRRAKAIGRDLNQKNEQFNNCKGYDHNFVLNRKTDSGLELAATVYEPSNGRYMEVYTTEPAIQFYGGNFFDGSTTGKSNKPLRYRESLALETQHYPDSPNQPNFPSTILKPTETYKHICIYRFGVK